MTRLAAALLPAAGAVAALLLLRGGETPLRAVARALSVPDLELPEVAARRDDPAEPGTPEAEEWRAKYRAEFERKERFSDDVAKPIHLEFDEEFYRMLGDELAYRKTLVEICRTLEPGMREVFEGVDRMIEEGLFAHARKPLDELGLESKDQRIWRLLSAYVNWRAKVDAKAALEGDHHQQHA